MAISALLMVGLVIFTLLHATQARQFAAVVEHARPIWVLLALGLQLGTYACAGAIWRVVAAAGGHRIRLSHLARLAIEKLSIDQLLPSGGFSGNVVVIAAMRRLGLPPSVAAEAIVIDALARYAAFALVTGLAFVVLWIHHDVTPRILSLAGALMVLLAAVPITMWWLLRHREWKPGPRLQKLRVLRRTMSALAEVSPARIRDPKLLGAAGIFNLAIFVLDSLTLWAVLYATGSTVDVLTAFAALVVASLAGTFTLLPGGVGSFEAGCTATLTLLGVPIEAALAGTLFLRGLTLWLPLVPGILLARRDLSLSSTSVRGDSDAA